MLNNPFGPYVEAVERTIQETLLPPFPEVESLYGMMRYHMGWVDETFAARPAPAGKRVRPLLCLLACQAAGGDWHQALPVAAGLELVHNFSLIHDDIEDNSRTRHHRATVWALWGVPQAVNTGDAMFTLARLAAHRLAERGIAPEVVLAVLRCVEESCLALCQGQYMDMAFETARQVSLAGYLKMIEGKTAGLLAGAAQCGALIGGGPAGPHQAFFRFGQELGLAFQIIDDILGIWGDPRVTGKPAADDVRNRKKTFPVLHALNTMTQRGEKRLAELLAQEPLGEADVQSAIAEIERAGSRERANQVANEHTEAALGILEQATPPSPARDGLRELARRLVSREH